MEYKKFEELSLEELYEILKARYEVFTVGQKCLYQDCDDKDKNSYHLYVEEDDKVVAYLRIVDKGISYDEVSIGRVMVLESHRGKGLAREMTLKAIEFIKNNLGENRIKISAQEYVKEFYKGLGFKEVSDVYLEVEIPHIEMVYEC
ncbi:acetyltransferase, GNAT family [Gottschalkia acidurici 9a]|uniref:Acetyltransferase, GNAT family n=1 Tax=Gottschalkia acidurici (strain ATCC 7906 / DSM 604 / BCRC 14475 / CIP 104303 / KCTC 5404 / NCIMB 10678 / 9a) TaxID=1128398 RepID=K0AZR2_GOTA9|nr:GNAT family N-acetyltransferase [Gottschalkia acidurici]AFS78272.1 acetyltransferase, GNAT family [Gottschalkia acidurici 9a]